MEIRSMKIYKAKGKKTLINHKIPECSGVYFIWGDNELLYIGKGKNLRTRIAQHMGYGFKQHMINPEEAKKVSIIFTKDEFDAERLEKQLIKLIPSKWNSEPFYKKDWYNDWRFGTGMFAKQ